MSTALLLLPDFLLIGLGFVLCHRSALNRLVWDATERPVYYLLFPVLPFNSIVKSPLQPGQTPSLARMAPSIALCVPLWLGVLAAWR